MEKNMKKYANYGFLITLALAVLFVKYKVNTPFDYGYSTK